jgi:hypothetical protein
MLRSLHHHVVLAFLLLITPLATRSAEPVNSMTIKAGQLSVLFHDNSRSPGLLSGVQSLFNTRRAPGFDAFDPASPGASAGLNFEHIISGHTSPANSFSPRRGPYTIHRLALDTVMLKRRHEDSPWAMSSTMVYTVKPPYYIDFEFSCTPHDASLFAPQQHAIFFWADYMNDVMDISLHFLGQENEGGKEKWISADAPAGHPDHVGGGTYRNLAAGELDYDADHNFKLNSWSYDWPRYTRPFYVGRAAQQMCLMLMFDRAYSERDEIRFSLFKFKVKEDHLRPAWDFQYVVHEVQEDHIYGFRGRLVWKKFRSLKNCRAEYNKWTRQLEKPPKPLRGDDP